MGVSKIIPLIMLESLADSQLARFRANPANRGKTCRSGLWRYSRHPNYFFEWIGWFAYALFAVDLFGGLGFLREEDRHALLIIGERLFARTKHMCFERRNA